MPATHVLKDGLGRTIDEILEIDHAGAEALVTIRNRPGIAFIPMNDLTIVPRRELLAGQVLFA